MDIVKRLIRYVTRGFCELKSILIIDAILIHGVLTDEELWHMLGINRKELRGLCSKLKEDHLLADHVQREEGPAQRPVTKTYYYIHYTETIDAIKWKMHSIVNRLQEQVGAESQPQGYVCPTCKTRYSMIDVVRTFNDDLNDFVCDVCDSRLREDDSSAESQAQQEKLGRLMSQIEPIIESLRQIDEVHIPENTFQSSLAHALPAPTSGPTSNADLMSSALASSIKFAKTASQGGANGAASLQVNITSDKESIEIERKNREEKARLAEENALPTWHLESTVGKSLHDTTANEQQSAASRPTPVISDKSTIKMEDADKAFTDETKPATFNTATSTSANDTSAEDKASEEALAAYYAQLAARQENSDEEEDDDDDDDDEEDEDDDDAEFEDVISAPIVANDEDDDDEE